MRLYVLAQPRHFRSVPLRDVKRLRSVAGLQRMRSAQTSSQSWHACWFSGVQKPSHGAAPPSRLSDRACCLPRPALQLGKFAPAARIQPRRDHKRFRHSRRPIESQSPSPKFRPASLMQRLFSSISRLLHPTRQPCHCAPHCCVRSAPANHGEKPAAALNLRHRQSKARAEPISLDHPLGHALGSPAVETMRPLATPGKRNCVASGVQFTPQRCNAGASQIDAFEPLQSLCRRDQSFADQSAILSAARGVRLAERVCKKYSLPSSTVNSIPALLKSCSRRCIARRGFGLYPEATRQQ